MEDCHTTVISFKDLDWIALCLCIGYLVPHFLIFINCHRCDVKLREELETELRNEQRKNDELNNKLAEMKDKNRELVYRVEDFEREEQIKKQNQEYTVPLEQPVAENTGHDDSSLATSLYSGPSD